jgi:hypothetical protein
LSEVETARLTQDAFRHQFLRLPENRQWLMDRLPAILTPRLSANLGSKFLTRLFGIVRKNGGEADAGADMTSRSQRMTMTDRGYADSDVETGRTVNYALTPHGRSKHHQSRREVSSSDSDSGDQGVVRVRDDRGMASVINATKCRPADLDKSATHILRVWLHLCRRRLTLQQWANEFAVGEGGGDECATCEALVLKPHERVPMFRVPLRQLIDMHEQSDTGLALTTQLDRNIWLVRFCEFFDLDF